MKQFKKIYKVAVGGFFLFALPVNSGAQHLGRYFSGSGGENLSSLVEELQASKGNVPSPAPSPSRDDSMVDNPAGSAENSNEFIQFWEDLKKDVIEDVCKAARIELSQKAELANVAGIKGKFKRYLKQYPDKKIALIDEVGVELSGNVGHEILEVNDRPFNVSLSAKMKGASVVVRKLNGVRYCKEILTLVDLRKVKTILPVNSRRINKMKPGEIWKFPIELRVGIGGSIGGTYQGVSVGISFGYAKEKKPSVTLYKINEKTLRLRVRLDRATFKSIGANVSALTISAGDIGFLPAENVLTKLVAKEVAKQFNKYLSFKLGISRSKVRGKKVLLEFLLNAKDPAQIDRLVEFLRGDLGVIRKLIEMGQQFNGSDSESGLEDGQHQIDNVENVAEDSLGANSNFAGTNHFNAVNHNFNIQLPVIVSYHNGSTIRYDRYQTLNGKQVLHVHQASRNTSSGNFNLPFLGKYIKHNVRDTVYVVNYEKSGKQVENPVVLYQRYDGEVRRSESDAREMIEKMNDIMKYAGAKGEGTNEAYTIDTSSLFPELNKPVEYEDGVPVNASRTYRSAVLSFTLLFTREAVQEIINAPARLIMKAFFNILEGFDKKVISKVAHLFRIDEKGKIKYDYRKARRILEREFWWLDLDNPEEGRDSPLDTLRDIKWQVARIIKDFDYIKAAPDWKEQAKRLSKVFAGKKKGNLGYNKMMKLVIQFVEPHHIYARMKFNTNKKIDGENDINLRESFFNTGIENTYTNQMSNATALRDMFNNPSTLTD